ncbi:hypothetical protein RIR_jg4043.t1 [Rhizophagus irregularis DAOM 181602=DAOM 197198]|nr:hypothetical protein RIR_jg4043.t1 [Rhizophagus irregularis DAOM 181602=DAOM 197198]
MMVNMMVNMKSWNKVINGEGRPLPLSSPLDLKEDQVRSFMIAHQMSYSNDNDREKGSIPRFKSNNMF